MQVKDLQPKQGNVDITLEVTEKAEPREFEKFGKPGKVCNAKGKDETGTVTVTLWNEDVDKVNVGDKITIKNGWVSEWQGDLQLSTGRFGQMEVEKGSGAPSAPAEPESSVDSDVEVEEV